MTNYDLYGFSGNCLSEARDLLCSLLNINFHERDGTYQGGIYFLSGDRRHEHFMLKENVDPFDDSPEEVEFSDYRYLLYVNNTSRPLELRANILSSDKFILLRRESLR
ncbi:hypothetical protein SOASR031_26270 [Leminorella grimontii]|nr:hypothetical protein SOASR031_26270 [Leminorella grimontii]